MELVREERVRPISNTRAVATNIKEKSKLNLFQNFYEDITGEQCSEEYMEVMTKVIEKADRGGEV